MSTHYLYYKHNISGYMRLFKTNKSINFAIDTLSFYPCMLKGVDVVISWSVKLLTWHKDEWTIVGNFTCNTGHTYVNVIALLENTHTHKKMLRQQMYSWCKKIRWKPSKHISRLDQMKLNHVTCNFSMGWAIAAFKSNRNYRIFKLYSVNSLYGTIQDG